MEAVADRVTEAVVAGGSAECECVAEGVEGNIDGASAKWGARL